MVRDYYLKLLPVRIPKPLKTAELVCERCQKKFTVPFWMVKKGRRFCKAACRRADPLQTLLSRIEKQSNGCWNYTGVIGWGGYGQLKVGQTNWSAHKLMWILWNKKRVPTGLVVRHTCIGNRRCINPKHLIPGTQKQNVHDMIRQGRFRIVVGTERSFAHLNAEQVIQMRALRPIGLKMPEAKYSYKTLGTMFNVPAGAAWQVVNMKTYKNVNALTKPQ